MQNDVSIAVLYGMEWAAFRPYAVSLVRSWFEGVRVVFVENITPETRTNFEKLGFVVKDIQIPVVGLDALNQPGNAFAHNFGRQRPLEPARFLEQNAFRYVIWTGARDVFFQSNPVTWLEKNLEDKELVLAGLRHTSVGCPYNDTWIRNAAQDDSLWDEVRNQEALCTDIMAGTSDAMHDLLMDIYEGCLQNPYAVDQAMMNCLVRTSPYKEISLVPGIDETFGLQWWPERRANAVKYPNNLKILPSPDHDPVFDEYTGEIRNAAGELYSMVHFYDRSQKWKEIVRKKYQ